MSLTESFGSSNLDKLATFGQVADFAALFITLIILLDVFQTKQQIDHVLYFLCWRFKWVFQFKVSCNNLKTQSTSKMVYFVYLWAVMPC